MGIDIKNRGRKKKTCRDAPKSNNPYLKIAVKLYRLLSRRTDSKFNKIVLKRLFMSKSNRPPVSVSKITEIQSKQKDENIYVVIGTVTNDERLNEIPKMKVCALKFTETARARIINAGGECMTFDQLALAAPKGSNAFLVQGKRKARKAYKHFGKPCSKNSTARPYSKTKGRKAEKARR